MRKIRIVALILLCINVFAEDAKTIRVGVIDTGFDFKSTWSHLDNAHTFKKPILCKSGHKDVTITNNALPQDTHGHGTHVAGIIGNYAKGANYCLVIVKYYKDSNSGLVNLRNSIKALKHLHMIGVDIINYSGGGVDFSYEEYGIVQKLLDAKVKFVAAAGNGGFIIDYYTGNQKFGALEIDYVVDKVENSTIYYINPKTKKVTKKEPKHQYYPANYDERIIGVKALLSDSAQIANQRNVLSTGKDQLASLSNRGNAFKYSEVGIAVGSITINNKFEAMSGTSQACAVKTGKIVKDWGRK